MSGLRSRRTLGKMIDNGFTSFGRCVKCGKEKAVDLKALAEIKGRDYSLWNRSPRCSLTEGCPGRIRFFVGPGWPTADFDEATEWRWFWEG